jgi:hypothetical protein
VHAQQVRGARRLLGGSDGDTALVISLITDTAMCGDYIARKAGIPCWQTDDAIRSVERTIQVTTTVAL